MMPPYIKDLEEAVIDLRYTSEADEPAKFEVIHWGHVGKSLSNAQVLALIGYPAKSHVTCLALNDFFETLVKAEAWHNTDEQLMVKRYQKLQHVLQNLSDIKVWIIGHIQLVIVLTGKLKNDTWVGVRTTAVQT